MKGGMIWKTAEGLFRCCHFHFIRNDVTLRRSQWFWELSENHFSDEFIMIPLEAGRVGVTVLRSSSLRHLGIRLSVLPKIMWLISGETWILDLDILISKPSSKKKKIKKKNLKKTKTPSSSHYIMLSFIFLSFVGILKNSLFLIICIEWNYKNICPTHRLWERGLMT